MSIEQFTRFSTYNEILCDFLINTSSAFQLNILKSSGSFQPRIKRNFLFKIHHKKSVKPIMAKRKFTAFS